MTGVSWKSLRQTAEDASKPLADGWYECAVDSAEATQASTGSEMIKVVLQVVDGPHANRKLWTQFVFSPENPNALIFFFRNMAAFGLGEDFFDNLTAQGLDVRQSMQLIAQTLDKRRIRVRTSIRKWNGADRNNVEEFQPSEGGPGGLPGGQPAVGLPSIGGAGAGATPVIPAGLGSLPGSTSAAAAVPAVPAALADIPPAAPEPQSTENGGPADSGPPLPF